jgi:hypothetical protein
MLSESLKFNPKRPAEFMKQAGAESINQTEQETPHNLPAAAGIIL